MSDFKKQLVLEGGILLAIIAILGGGILYLYFLINGNLATIHSDRVKINWRQQDLNTLVQLRKGANAASAMLPQLQAKLPSKDKLFDFSKTLEQMAKSRNLQFGFSFGGEVSGGASAPSFVPFQIATGGDVRAIEAFLEDVERSNYLVVITDVDLNSVSTRINGRVFYK